MIYTDGIHLVTDGPIEELHAFAKRIGMKREWFQDHRHPHYDVRGVMIDRAIEAGAQFVRTRWLIEKTKEAPDGQ